MTDDFTPEQRKKLLKILEEHDRAVWLWATIGVWLKWIGAVLATLVAFKVLLGDYLRGTIGR